MAIVMDSHSKSNIIRDPAAREGGRPSLNPGHSLERLTCITDFWTGRLIAGVIAAAFILSYGAASEVIS